MPFFCSLIKYCCFGEKIGVYLSVDLNLSLEELPKNLFFRRLLLSFRRWIHLLINEMSCFLQFIIYYYTQKKFLHWNLHFMSLNYHLVGNHSGSYLVLIISRTHFTIFELIFFRLIYFRWPILGRRALFERISMSDLITRSSSFLLILLELLLSN